MNPGWRSNYIRYKSYFLNVVGRYRERADVRAYLEILLSLATVSIFSVFALRPTLLTIAQLLREIETKRETLAKMQSKIQNLAQAQSTFDREGAKIKLLETTIPEKPTPEVFARQVEGLSSRHQVEITSISLGEAVIAGIATTDTKEVTATASAQQATSQSNELEFEINMRVPVNEYLALSNFISDLEKLRRPLKIDTLRLNTQLEKEVKFLLLIVEGKMPYY